MNAVIMAPRRDADMSEADADGDIDRLLGEALDLEPADREQFLHRMGASDGPLRDRLSKLIGLAAQDGGFLSRSPVRDAAGASEQPEEDLEPAAAGTLVGPYRIVREIGRGGMGAVYLAERTDGQFQKHVAVKLIKRGMDTAAVLRRFRDERQILADLEHPNIARLLDAGRPTMVGRTS